MTIPDLITLLLTAIRNQFYTDAPARDYPRDINALTKAIARYGYACNQRAWDFQPDFILRDILDLLNQIKRTGTEIQWFPIYLEHAIDRHIRIRAEELSAKAKTIAPKTANILNQTKPVVVIEKTATETLAALYTDLKAARKRKPKNQPRSSRGNEALTLNL